MCSLLLMLGRFLFSKMSFLSTWLSSNPFRAGALLDFSTIRASEGDFLEGESGEASPKLPRLLYFLARPKEV